MQLILNAKDGAGALIQRRGKDTQTEVMNKDFVFLLLLELTLLSLKRTYTGGYFLSIWLTNRSNLQARLPLPIHYYSTSLVPTYCIYSAVFGYSCLKDE